MKIEKLILAIVMSCFLAETGFCAQTAQQVLSPSVPQVLSIEKVIVETVEYNRDEPLANMMIKNSQLINPDSISLELSPVKIQIHTNVGTPIIVYAKFRELKHAENKYNFNQSRLTVLPSSYTINNPYDHVESGIFTPYINVGPDTVTGEYKGAILFTLGAI